MAALAFIGCIAIALLAFVVLPEISRRAHRQRAEDGPVALKPRGQRDWKHNGEDYDRVWPSP